MNRDELFPHVVPTAYLQLPPEFDEPLTSGAFGLVRPIGHDVIRLLVQKTPTMIRNVHESDLSQIGLSAAEAEQIAIDNLSRLIDSGAFQLQLTQAKSGDGYIVWMGEFTAACILWPRLYESSRKRLSGEELLVIIPQKQLMFVLTKGDSVWRANMRQYIHAVVANMPDRISDSWFSLTADGLSEFAESQPSQP